MDNLKLILNFDKVFHLYTEFNGMSFYKTGVHKVKYSNNFIILHSFNTVKRIRSADFIFIIISILLYFHKTSIIIIHSLEIHICNDICTLKQQL